MKRENFYTIVIILLLLLNFATIGYLFLNKNDNTRVLSPDQKRNKPEQIIIAKLNLNDEQVKQFRIYKQKHGNATHNVERKMKSLQRELFSLVKADSMDIDKRDSLLSEIEQCESDKHLLIIEHFQDLRSMMRPDQIELYNDFIEEMGRTITSPGGPMHGPPPPRRH